MIHPNLMCLFLGLLSLLHTTYAQTEPSVSNGELESLKAKCRENDTESMVKLGRIYLKDSSKTQMATTCFERAAELNSTEAMFELYLVNQNNPGKRTASVRWLEKAASQGNVDAILEAWRLVGTDTPYTAHLSPKIRAWGQSAADAGDSNCCHMMGHCFMFGVGGDVDLKKSFEYYAKAIERGSFISATILGSCYIDGTAPEKDIKKGFELLYRGINGESSGSYLLLGMALLENVVSSENWAKYGDPIDPRGLLAGRSYAEEAKKQMFEAYEEECVNHLNKAASLGNSIAMNILAEMYAQSVHSKLHQSYFKSEGIRLSTDEPSKAFENARQSAEAGDVDGMILLSDFYGLGWGTKPSARSSFEWMQRASKSSADAMFWLGLFYARGYGVRPNMVSCVKLMRESSSKGNANAKQFLEELQKRMEEEKIARLEAIQQRAQDQQRVLALMWDIAAQLHDEEVRMSAVREKERFKYMPFD